MGGYSPPHTYQKCYFCSTEETKVTFEKYSGHCGWWCKFWCNYSWHKKLHK